MGEVIQLDDRRRINEEAASWLSRIDRGLSDVERHELDAWLRSEPRHVAAFLELARAWDKLEELGALSGLVELPPSSNTRVLRTKRFGAMAGVFAVALLGVILAMNYRSTGVRPASNGPASAASPERDPSGEASGSTMYSTGTGEQRRVTLSDGSVVSLNTRSTLSVSFDERHRRVSLQGGEASFEVAHDTSRPFIVEAAGKTIRAVGTIFTVRAKSKNSVSVIVSEGRVAVSTTVSGSPVDSIGTSANSRPTRLLEAGDRLELIGSQMQFERLSLTDLDDALAWQNGMIVFQGDPLVDALGEVSRYSDARFELADESIGEMRVAGVFQIKDVDGFVESLRANLGIGTKPLSDGTLSLYRLDGESRAASTD